MFSICDHHFLLFFCFTTVFPPTPIPQWTSVSYCIIFDLRHSATNDTRENDDQPTKWSWLLNVNNDSSVSSIFVVSAAPTIQLGLEIEPGWLFTVLSKPMIQSRLQFLRNDETILKSALSALTCSGDPNLSLLEQQSWQVAHVDISRNRHPGHLPSKKHSLKKKCLAVFTSNAINLGYFLASKRMDQRTYLNSFLWIQNSTKWAGGKDVANLTWARLCGLMYGTPCSVRTFFPHG